MFCPHCGKEIEDSSLFCRFCGYKIEDNSENQVNATDVDSVIEDHSVIADENNAEEESQLEEAVEEKKAGKILLTIGKIVSGIGVVGFLLIVLIGLLGYGRVYFYDGYKSTAVFCTLSLILMLCGFVLLLIGLLTSKKSTKNQKKAGVTLAVILMILSVGMSSVLIYNDVKGQKHSSSHSSSSSSGSSGSGASSYQMDHATYCLLYMKVKDVKIKRDGNWVYCTGSVQNTGTYQIKYVKVRAGFKDAKGNVIDSDWTYAVDSDWLNPGESKSFEMMIKDENKKIKDADVMVVYE